MSEKNIFFCEIEEMTNLGAGVTSLSGKKVFVKGGVRKDLLNAFIIKDTSSYSIAAIDSVVTPSDLRIQNDCPAYKNCGGCVFRHVSYEEEKRIKYNHVMTAFRKYSGKCLPDTLVAEQIRTYSCEAYRNNVRFPVGKNKEGKLFPGFFSERSHKLVDATECKIQKKEFLPILQPLFAELDAAGLSEYREETGKGYLRHVCMRCNRDGEIMICFVINGEAEVNGALYKAAVRISESFPQIVGVYANINKEKTNVIFGNKTIPLVFKRQLTETMCGKVFTVSPRSFFQVNTEAAEMLYNRAGDFLRESQTDIRVLLDIYCGTGTIGLCLLPEGAKLYGCEIIPEAVADAVKNASLNGHDGTDCVFECCDASKCMESCKNTFGNPDAIIVDPPRKGLSADTAAAIIESDAKTLIYISCNPDSLARDTEILYKGGFIAERIALFDLFSRTSHVETLVLFTRNEKHIS